MIDSNMIPNLADLKAAFDVTIGIDAIANNLTTTESGKVLDARQGKALKDAVDATVLTPSTNISLPSTGAAVAYNMPGMTDKHVLIYWNFSSSPENNPPINLQWDTYNGYFVITNLGGSSSQYIKPVFCLPKEITISARQ